MSRQLRLLLVVAAAVVAGSRHAAALDDRQPIDITSDVLEYNVETQVLTATGNVVVTQGSATLTANEINYNRESRMVDASGRVVYEDDQGILSAETLTYDLVQRNADVSRSKGYGAPWLFNADEWKKTDDLYVGRGVDFTTCNLEPPHYHVRSSRLNLVPDQHFWAWNNTAYVEHIPMFFTPFMYRSLMDRRLVFQVRPGNDSINGAFARTATTYRFSDTVYNRLMVDYYAKQGTGFGNEFNYTIEDRMKGSLFGYYIDPRGNPDVPESPTDPQYNLRSYHWQRLTPTVIAQSNINLRKNISFNNQYFPDDFNQAVSEITSSVALTQQKERYNHKIIVERLDAPDPGDRNTFAQTHVQTASYPRYELQGFQRPLWSPKVSTATTTVAGSTTPVPVPSKPSRIGPLLMSYNADAARTYRRDEDKTRATSGGAMTFSQVYTLSRKWTLTPSISPGIRWQDKEETFTDGREPFRGFQGRVATSEVLRYRPVNWLTVDNTYALTARLRPNRISVDSFPRDNGIETNRYSFFVYARPNRRTLVRSFGGYDFRAVDDESVSDYRARKFEPFTSELTYNPTDRTQIFLRESFAIYGSTGTGNYGSKRPTVQSWQASVSHLGLFGTEVETGFLYNRGERGRVTWNQRLSFYFSPSWRVLTRLHTIVPTTGVRAAKRAQLVETEVRVRRELHCWYGEFIFRDRPPFSREYSVLLSVKMGREEEKQRLTERQIESQFYPWRARE